MRGFLAPELGQITYLEELYVLYFSHSHVIQKTFPVMLSFFVQFWTVRLKVISVSYICRILHSNKLIGIIPKELGMLKSLKVLDLGMNQLSGPIPPEIGNSTQLVKM